MRVSLHRTRADWPIVAAAGLIAVLAATLLAAGPIYSSAVSVAGLHRQLESAPASDAASTSMRPHRCCGGPRHGPGRERRHPEPDRYTGVDVVAIGMSGSYTLPGQDADVRIS